MHLRRVHLSSAQEASLFGRVAAQTAALTGVVSRTVRGREPQAAARSSVVATPKHFTRQPRFCLGPDQAARATPRSRRCLDVECQCLEPAASRASSRARLDRSLRRRPPTTTTAEQTTMTPTSRPAAAAHALCARWQSFASDLCGIFATRGDHRSFPQIPLVCHHLCGVALSPRHCRRLPTSRGTPLCPPRPPSTPTRRPIVRSAAR